jgi:hypothetical protein
MELHLFEDKFKITVAFGVLVIRNGIKIIRLQRATSESQGNDARSVLRLMVPFLQGILRNV